MDAPARSSHQKPQRNEPQFLAREECFRVLGVDLTSVPGFKAPTVLVLLYELGPEFAEKFPTAKHFGSWPGLCPDHRITGGKIYSVKTRAVKSRVASALRMAAQKPLPGAKLFWRLIPALEGAAGRPQSHHRPGP